MDPRERVWVCGACPVWRSCRPNPPLDREKPLVDDGTTQLLEADAPPCPGPRMNWAQTIDSTLKTIFGVPQRPPPNGRTNAPLDPGERRHNSTQRFDVHTVDAPHRPAVFFHFLLFSVAQQEQQFLYGDAFNLFGNIADEAGDAVDRLRQVLTRRCPRLGADSVANTE